MALLLRSAMERANMKKMALVLLHLAATAAVAGVPAAAGFYSLGAMALARMIQQPSRRWVDAWQRARVRVHTSVCWLHTAPRLCSTRTNCFLFVLSQLAERH